MKNLLILLIIIGVIGIILITINNSIIWEEKDKETSNNLHSTGGIMLLISVILIGSYCIGLFVILPFILFLVSLPNKISAPNKIPVAKIKI